MPLAQPAMHGTVVLLIYNGGTYYHGGGYHNGSYYHGNGYYNGGTYYSGGGSGSGVVIGVPIGGYVAPICQSADVYDQTTGQYLLQQSCN